MPSFTRQADILIVAIGKYNNEDLRWVGKPVRFIRVLGHAELVKGDWIKPGAVVIDVGIDAVPDQSAKGTRCLYLAPLLVRDTAF